MSRADRRPLWLPLLLLPLLLFCGCHSGNRKAPEGSTLNERLMMFWSGICPDSLTADAREQYIVDFLYLMENADSVTRRAGWPKLHAALGDGPDRTVTDYLAEPDSPLYSPEMLDEYLTALTRILPSSDAGHIRALFLRENYRKNRSGAPIADLRLLSPKGATAALREVVRTLQSQGPEVTVLFYDPDCENCAAVIDGLAASTTSPVSSGTQDSSAFPDSGAVIAVSVTDATAPLPEGWCSFRAASREELDSAFFLPSLPALYLVDPALLTVLDRR